MATVFGQVERKLYDALLMPDASRRQAALIKWINLTIPIIQAAVNQELKDLVDTLMKDQSTDEKWEQLEKKLLQIENEYHMVLEIKLRKIYPNDYFHGSLPEPVIRFKIGSNITKNEIQPESIMKKNEIDLHGMTVAQAKIYVEDFLKDCHKTHEEIVWIIHGKGTGTLREEMRKLLTNHPLVESFSVADPNHGGEGATQVVFRIER
jgi:DNA-nicking Smr family endonuclease